MSGDICVTYICRYHLLPFFVKKMVTRHIFCGNKWVYMRTYTYPYVLRLDPGTPANKAMRNYFRKTTLAGEKRTSYAGAPATSIMTMLRDDYRINTSKAMKTSAGTLQFLYGRDLDKLCTLAQDRVRWAHLVAHIAGSMRVKWIQANCTRKTQAVPWSHTPVIRVSADDIGIQIQRRVEVQPRLLTFDEVEERNEDE